MLDHILNYWQLNTGETLHLSSNGVTFSHPSGKSQRKNFTLHSLSLLENHSWLYFPPQTFSMPSFLLTFMILLFITLGKVVEISISTLSYKQSQFAFLLILSDLFQSCGHCWVFHIWHKTWKDQFSFQFQRAMPKSVQTTAQLHWFHMLEKQCSKFSKPGFHSMWTKNFQMFKLDLAKAEEPETKLPTSVGS